MNPRRLHAVGPFIQAIEFYRQGRTGEAEAAGRKALAVSPEDPAVLHFVGMVLSSNAKHGEAINLLRRSVELLSAETEFRANLAAALGRAGRHEEAAQELKEVVRIRPNAARPWANLGVAMEHLKRYPEAVDAYRHSIRLDPSAIDPRVWLGNALRKQNRLVDAEEEYLQAIALSPESAKAWNGLASAYAGQNRLLDVISANRRLAALPTALPGDVSNLIYNLYYAATTKIEDMWSESAAWARRFTPTNWPLQNWVNVDRTADRRLRVGYVSAEFREHPVGRLLEPVIAEHDRNSVETYVYNDLRKTPDVLTARLRQIADHWREVASLTDEQLAAMIVRDKIDILVDLTGHFADHRLVVFAGRSAPIQVNAFGWCGTTGIPAIDYRLTDELSDPTGKTDKHHTEKLIRMPHCTWVSRPWDKSPDVGPPPSVANGFITFANLNNPIKTTPAMASLWCQILRRVPGSKLMLLCRPGAEKAVAEPFIERGVPDKRLLLIHGKARYEYMELYNRVDIVLDPFPFNGDNTTCDAFWMGVPVVSMIGNAFHSRRGFSHLSLVGLSELAAKSPPQYAEIAVALANDPVRLVKLRRELRDRLKLSPLGNVKQFVTDLENTYRRMWIDWCERNPRSAEDVPPPEPAQTESSAQASAPKSLVDYEPLLDLIREKNLLKLPGDLLEIGTLFGVGAAKISQLLRDHRSEKKLFVVDIFDPSFDQTPNNIQLKMDQLYSEAMETAGGGDQFRIYQQITAGCENIITIPGDSKSVCIPIDTLCFAFIDGNHDPEYVEHDFRQAWKRITPGGVVAMHDYGGDLPGVTETIDRLLREVGPEVAWTRLLPNWIVAIRRR